RPPRAAARGGAASIGRLAAVVARSRTACGLRAARHTVRTAAFDDLVDDAVVLGFVRAHEEVALGVVVDDLDGLAGVVGEDLIEAPADAQDLLSVDLDVGRLAAETRRGLMDEHARVGQAV